MQKEQREKDDSAWKSSVAGACGGLALVMVGYPFDLVKVRMQMQMGRKTARQEAKRILALDGWRGFYRGASAVLLGVMPVFGLLFWGYHVGQEVSLKVFPNDASHDLDASLGDRCSLRQIAFAGAISAIPTTLILGPAERIKVLLQMQEGKGTGVLPLVRDTWKRGGIVALGRGTLATLLRDSIGSAAYFWVYEYLKRKFARFPKSGIVVAGGLAGMAHWLLVMPIDVVKTRYQSSFSSMGMVANLRVIFRKEGTSGLYRGLGPSLARAFPANAASFATVEIMKTIL